MDLVLSRSFIRYRTLLWGSSTVLRAFLAVMKTREFGPFTQFYELLHTVVGSVDNFGTRGFCPSHSYMSHYILSWGPSTDLRAFLAFIKTRGFRPNRSPDEKVMPVLVPVVMQFLPVAVVPPGVPPEPPEAHFRRYRKR